MEPITIIILMIVLMLFLIICGVPIAFSIALAGGLGIVLQEDMATLLYSLGTFPVGRVGTYTWTIIPLFVLMGNFAEASGLASDAYRMANVWLSRLKGGLVLATIGSCGLIAATTGSGATGTVIMGKIAVPEMKKYGYNMNLATGAAACSGTVGNLIPPSGGLVIIGVLAELSIGKLFIAGILPGILSLVIYMIMVMVRCYINPSLAPCGRKYTFMEKLASLKQSWGIVLLFVVVIGGLYSGLATAIEVASIGCFVAFAILLLSIKRKRSTWGGMLRAIMDAIRLSAMIFAFIIGAGIFSLFITLSGIIPEAIEYVQNLSVAPIWILIIICVVYIPLGMFLDPLSMIFVTVPIVYPVVVTALGYDPIWFAIIIIKLVEISCITPPVGLNLFIMKGVFPEASLGSIIKGCGWFMVMDVFTIIILFLCPWIITWLPSTM